MGLYRAGFEVLGVDIMPQPNYPFEFHQADALIYSLDGYAAYWASPPCQGYTWATRKGRESRFPDLIAATRARLIATGKPYIIENVFKAPLINPIQLTGRMFGLGVIRKRWFECSFYCLVPSEDKRGSVKTGEYLTVVGHGGNSRSFKLQDWQQAMGIDWMTKEDLTQAVPPIYAEYLGSPLLAVVERNKQMALELTP